MRGHPHTKQHSKDTSHMVHKAESPNASQTKVFRGMSFKDGDVSFKILGRALGIPSKWKVNRYVPGSMTRGNNGGPIEMLETEIIRFYEAYHADHVVSRVRTEGESTGDHRRPRKDPVNIFKRSYSLRETILGLRNASI